MIFVATRECRNHLDMKIQCHRDLAVDLFPVSSALLSLNRMI
jgi:hypothetical protein